MTALSAARVARARVESVPARAADLRSVDPAEWATPDELAALDDLVERAHMADLRRDRTAALAALEAAGVTFVDYDHDETRAGRADRVPAAQSLARHQLALSRRTAALREWARERGVTTAQAELLHAPSLDG